MQTIPKKYQPHLETLLVFLLAAVMRLTSLNVFRAIDEGDRWAWAVDFYRALLAGDLPATLVGDGYPGIFPVWLETLWLLAATLYRSALQGAWLGNDGIYLLIHEWNRTAYQGVQRFPVALTNTFLVVFVFLYTRKLFGRWVGLLAAAFICLDPFYLSDSRVNRAEGLLTGLMTLSLLALISALKNQGSGVRGQESENQPIHNSQFATRYSQLALSAMFGGLALLTKSQALVLIPMFAVISFIWHWRTACLIPSPPNLQSPISQSPNLQSLISTLKPWLITMTLWLAGAVATFIILWPATWVVPGPTFNLMFTYLTRKVGEEGVKIFFLGRTILDEDPGLLFYPVIFILRATPVMLVGLLIGLWQLIKYSRITHHALRTKKTTLSKYVISFLDNFGIWALIAYVAMYVAGMSLGSHKQDRFLMAVFPSLYILAALAYVQFAKQRHWTRQKIWIGGAALLAIQLVTALPFHPYYFSYFNPLIGGGPVATQLTRIGWGEGMNEVADYLQSQENPEQITVATRWFKYLTGFRGQRINLNNDGDWARADKIIFYIQQEQRMLDPSPGVIRYFQQHIPPEKVITINGIKYATVYPNPIQYAATPLVDTIEGQMSLFGYRWDENSVRLYWENLAGTPQPVAVRLWSNANTHSNWQTCATVSGFETATRTPGEVVESDCPLTDVDLPPGLYDLQVGVRQSDETWQPLEFAAGWSAVEVTPNGSFQRVSAEETFAQLARQNVPPSATLLEHLYAGRVRLLAFETAPEQPQPGQPLTVTLYWQAQRVLDRDAHTSLQAFVGDNQQVAVVNTPPDSPTSQWHPGEVVSQKIQLDLPGNLLTPALLRLDVSLFPPETGNPVPVTNLQGQAIPGEIITLKLEPQRWPEYGGNNALNYNFGNAVTLTGYSIDTEWGLNLYWRSNAPLDQNLTTFVHLLGPDGALIVQSDVPPHAGLYPTSAWQPGEVVLSYHRLAVPSDLPPGDYTLVAGLYTPTDFTRLPATDESGQSIPNNAASIGEVTLP